MGAILLCFWRWLCWTSLFESMGLSHEMRGTQHLTAECLKLLLLWRSSLQILLFACIQRMRRLKGQSFRRHASTESSAALERNFPGTPIDGYARADARTIEARGQTVGLLCERTNHPCLQQNAQRLLLRLRGSSWNEFCP